MTFETPFRFLNVVSPMAHFIGHVSNNFKDTHTAFTQNSPKVDFSKICIIDFRHFLTLSIFSDTTGQPVNKGY